MKRTELLQEIRKMRFEEAYGGWEAGRLTQVSKLRDDEQKPDMRRGASGARGHVTAKPSICGNKMYFANSASMQGR